MSGELTKTIDQFRGYIQNHSYSNFVRAYAYSSRFTLELPGLDQYKDMSNEQIIPELINRLAFPPFEELPVEVRECILNLIRLVRLHLNK